LLPGWPVTVGTATASAANAASAASAGRRMRGSGEGDCVRPTLARGARAGWPIGGCEWCVCRLRGAGGGRGTGCSGRPQVNAPARSVDKILSSVSPPPLPSPRPAWIQTCCCFCQRNHGPTSHAHTQKTRERQPRCGAHAAPRLQQPPKRGTNAPFPPPRITAACVWRCRRASPPSPPARTRRARA
jgi:hypothetical protein